MGLTQAQQDAVAMAVDGADAGGKIMRLIGYAGTGKTFATKDVHRLLPGSLTIAPTGTAAKRSVDVTGVRALTFHKWRMEPVEDEDGKVQFYPLPILPSQPGGKCVERPASGLLVLEEGSMVQRGSWAWVVDAVRKMGISVLVVGDGFQLNPVDPGATVPFNLMGPDIEDHARVMLTEPQRTTADHPIYKIATGLRTANGVSEVRDVVRQMPVAPCSMARRIVQMREEKKNHIAIMHSNAERMQVNRDVRKLLGIKDPNLTPGEPTLIRRNNDAVGYCNGEIIECPEWAGVYNDRHTGAWTRFQLNGVECFTDLESMMGRRDPPREKTIAITCERTGFEYVHMQPGYGVTCHAAQGSEWEHVTIGLSSSLRMMDDVERARWLYTGWTRGRVRSEVVV